MDNIGDFKGNAKIFIKEEVIPIVMSNEVEDLIMFRALRVIDSFISILDMED